MKQRNLYVAALAMALVGCSNEEVVNMPDLSDTPISVIAGVKDMETRAGYDENNLPERLVLHVIQDASSTTSAYNYNKAEMMYNSASGKWEAANLPAGTLMLWKNSTPFATVISYTAPATSNKYFLNGGLHTFSQGDGTMTGLQSNMCVLEDQSTETALKQSDFLHYRGEGINPDTDGSITIPFSHVLSKLRISYKYGTELGDAVVSLSKCVISNVRVNLVMDFLNGKEGTLTAADGGYDHAVVCYVDDAQKEAEVILPPQVFESTPAKLSFYVLVGGEEKVFSCNIDAATLDAGKCYDMDVTIGRDRVAMGSVAINSWNTETEGGMLETE